MARAYAIFANGGKAITPMAIRTVEDKNGNVILNPELEIRQAQAAKGTSNQVITPQTAFVMTKLLEQTVNNGGTLHAQKWHFEYRGENGKRYVMPAGGKTGTTQNWADAWTCGITPYYAAAFWFGFDRPGQSLGLNITGATLAGFAWGEYFDKVHEDLPYKEWNKPLEGVIQVTVCAESGQLPTEACGDHTTTQWYLTGTQPTEMCPIHSNSSSSTLAIRRLEKEMIKSGQRWTQTVNTSPLTINWDILSADYDSSASDETGSSGDAEDSEDFESEQNIEYDYNFLME